MSLHRVLLIAIVTMVICIATLSIIIIWYPLISSEVFFKILATFGILIVAAALVMALRIDLSDHKNLKDQNYLD